jgi:hypothetical protein
MKKNQNTLTTNLVGLWVNLARVYEIAKLGNLSIRIVYQSDYKEASDDYKEIKSFYHDVKFASDGDLIVELFKPDTYESKRQFETLSDINKRVEKAKDNVLPTSFLNEASEMLLKTAVKRLNFSLIDVKKVKQIAAVISKLDGYSEIRTEHLAEAIQYRAFMNDDIAINAENCSIRFGSGITISRNDIDSKFVKAAIEHLQKLL